MYSGINSAVEVCFIGDIDFYICTYVTVAVVKDLHSHKSLTGVLWIPKAKQGHGKQNIF